MEKTQVLIQFYLLYNHNSDNKFLFWSCVLDTDVEEVDYNLLTSNARKQKLDIEDFSVYAEFSKFDGCVNSAYQKRKAVFLPVDKNSLKCSPYISSCAELENYYDTDFYVKFISFINSLDADFSEFDKLRIQKSVISAIKSIIGIDILAQESIPGSITIYKSLPVFKFDGNYNFDRGERYIRCSFVPEEDCDYFLEIEILDEKKILYKRIHNLKPHEEIVLPNETELESFGYIHLSIFKQDCDNKMNIVYEESGHLIRYFSFGINTGGGNYKLIQNRFIGGKKLEKIALTDYIKDSSKKLKFDPYLIEEDYKNLIFGKDKRFLESKFFSDNPNGRKEFLDWTRNVLQRAKEVTIIDPFFDLNGFNDFNSCASTYFSLTVLTTDPAKCLRDNQHETNNSSEELVKLITQSFQSAKVYYVDRAKLHDRYLIIFDGEDTIYYNLSNSWNGTVNNYSLFVQELELSIALQVKECYSKYFDEEYLQKVNRIETNKNDECDEKAVISEEKVRQQFLSAKNIVQSIDNDSFYALFSDLFMADYYGCKAIDNKFKLLPLCISKLEFVEEPGIFIGKLVSKILNEQKANFEKEQRFLFSEKPFEQYDSISDCLKLASSRNFCGGMPYYDLKIKYEDYKILEACFVVFPSVVIKELCEQEKSICIFNKGSKSEIKYYVSEQIISCMLSENFRFFSSQETFDLIVFANKSENLYCKTYIAQWILDTDDERQSFEEKINNLSALDIGAKDFALMLGEFCSEKFRIKNESFQKKTDIVTDFICKKYAMDKDELIIFALHAYLFSYEIEYDKFVYFLTRNKIVENELKKILLIYALNQVSDKKLFLLLEKYLEKELFAFLPKAKEAPTITDVGKFINYIPFIGQILCNILRDNPEKLQGLIFKFDIYPNFIFEVNRHPADDFDCYVLLIILNALYEMKQQSIDVSGNINSIKWYIPYLLNAHGGDFYGLSFRILDVYITFLSDSEKKDLMNKLVSEKQKLFVISTMQDEITKALKRFQSFITVYNFDRHDKTVDIIYLLAISINLIFYSDSIKSGNDSLISLLSNIKSKFKNSIDSEKIQNCIEKGMSFYSENTEENKRLFIKELKTLYYPYTTYKFVEECNG